MYPDVSDICARSSLYKHIFCKSVGKGHNFGIISFLVFVCSPTFYLFWAGFGCMQAEKVQEGDGAVSHFQYLRHMGFATDPCSRSWVDLFQWESWKWAQILTDSFNPIVIFHKPHMSRTFWHLNGIFRQTNQGKMYFVQDLSLSQQHTLVRSGIRDLCCCWTVSLVSLQCFQHCFPTG